jgi:hypothetical protein
MASFLTSCYPAEVGRFVTIPQKNVDYCFSKKLQPVPANEKRAFNKSYYKRINTPPFAPPGSVNVQKVSYDQISPQDLSAGLIYKQKGFFTGGKGKSQRRKKKTRKHRRKTRKYKG